MASKVFILDNGGYTIKAGYATDLEPRVIPNCITKAKNDTRKAFIGSQVDECKDFSGLFYAYACTRGFLENWEVEKQVWDHVFGSDHYNVDFHDTSLVVTEQHFNFKALRETMAEVMFEGYEFHSVLVTNSSYLSACKAKIENPSEVCSLIVDSGFSDTCFVPYIGTEQCTNNTRIMGVGGKVLTNHLKEIISYRQLNLMDETYVVNQVKEDVCFVTADIEKDLKIAGLRGKENTIVRDYVLPDYKVIRRGYVRPLEETTGKPKDNEQLIRMNNERFMVPEILFHPSDVNFNSMGLSESIVHCISGCPEEVQPHLYKNIVLTGGNACFPGFRDRVYNDVRKEANFLFDVKVTLAENPVVDAWEGGAMMSNDPHFYSDVVVTRKEYDEYGVDFYLEQFDDP